MSISQADIVKIVNSIFVEKFEFAEEELTPEKHIFQDLQIDSLDIVDLMMGLQQKLGVQLRDNQEIRQVQTLQDIYDLVTKLVEADSSLEEKARRFLQN